MTFTSYAFLPLLALSAGIHRVLPGIRLQRLHVRELPRGEERPAADDQTREVMTGDDGRA